MKCLMLSIMLLFSGVANANVGYASKIKGRLLHWQNKAKAFVRPGDDGYSPLQITVAAGAFALTCGWSVGITGCCMRPNGEIRSSCYKPAVMYGFLAAVGIVLIGAAVGNNSPSSPLSPSIEMVEQQHLSNIVVSHRLEDGGEVYEGVLVSYRYGDLNYAGLAFSPHARLELSLQNNENGVLGFREEPIIGTQLEIKHLDGITPNRVIAFDQIENALLKPSSSVLNLLDGLQRKKSF